MKGATCDEGKILPHGSSFNSRSREGSDLTDSSIWHAIQQVSIHAPVKGATEHDATGAIPINVSIHAPVKGATARATRSFRR